MGLIVAVISGVAVLVRVYKHGLYDNLVREFAPYFVGGFAVATLFLLIAKWFYKNT